MLDQLSHLLLHPANTSFNSYRMLMLLYSKVQFLLKERYAKRDSVFYSRVLNIKRFDIALKHFHFKIRKNGYSIKLIVVIAFNAVSGN